jgi:hypothetical protein
MPPESIGRWIARLFLWLVPAYVAWVLLWTPLAALQAQMSMIAANAWFPGLVSGWERSGDAIDFVTRLHAVAGGRTGDLLFTVNPRVYSYGLPLFIALSLATDPKRWMGLAGGLAVLLAAAAWGTLFAFLQQVFIEQGAIAARDFLPTPLGRNLIALGYQIGTILLPAGAPAVAWGVVHRQFLARWAGWPRRDIPQSTC